MYDTLLEHIHKNLPQAKTHSIQISDYFTIEKARKKQFLHEEGEVCRFAGFIVKGCCRNFVLTSEGKEVNLSFGFENWWIGDVSSFVNQTPSEYSCQFLEDSDYLSITAKNYEAFLNDSPCFREYTQKLRSRSYQSTILNYSGLSESAETRYVNLINKFPGIEQRISQKNIASFLQITPEALSRIKKSRL